MNLKIKKPSVLLALGILSSGISSAKETPKPCEQPHTQALPVADTYQGVEVQDPFRWLEATDTAEVKAWTEAQSAYANCMLSQLPFHDEIQKKLQAWNDFHSSTVRSLIYRGGSYFALKLQPPKNQPFLVVMTSLTEPGAEPLVVDPNLIDPSGTTAIDFFTPSLDGKYVAVSLSKGGSEEGTLHIYKTRDGSEASDPIPLVNKATAGGSVAWNQDSTGFYYTRYPNPGERAAEDLDFYQQIFFHKLGTEIKADTYSLGKDFPRIAEIELESADDGSSVLASVANGDGGEYAHYFIKPEGQWVQITQFKDKIRQAKLGRENDVFLVSLDKSPRGKVLHLSLDEFKDGRQPKLSTLKPVIKETEEVVSEILPTDSRVYVDYLAGGPKLIKVYQKTGPLIGALKIPPVSDISDLGRTSGNGIFFRSQSYVQAAAWYEYFPPMETKKENLQPNRTVLVTQSPVDFGDVEVKREMAKSKDGTLVPISILYKKGMKKDGTHPTLLTAYGGYGISLTPRFQQDIHLWIEHGGIYAIANLRGGSEFGENWHLSGNLTHKQNVFDDFIASAEHLIQEKYTQPNRLAIEGGSNGGLLMGAALTQRPELFHSVVSHVGIYDMLRVELDPNGAFNVTEFGSVKDPAQFKALYAYSPYHHVDAKAAYPSVLFLTGANDGRVNPYHSKKMAAALQAVSKKNPVLLRVIFDGGHGMGRSTSQKVAEEADVFSFLFSQFGMKY
jgi:prolyl oligopeptidase